nr:hypothetical protein [Bdellovibrionales bacterium]
MRFALALILILISACSQMSTRKTDESQISELARTKLAETRELIKADKLKQAVAKLSELNDSTLSPLE